MKIPLNNRYWAFYWPLALMGLTVLLAEQYRNGTLARYPDAARTLATFAVASSLLAINQASLIFVPQLVNVYARSLPARRMCIRFVMVLCGVLTLPILFLGFTPAGKFLIGEVFDLDADSLASIVFYLKITAPIIFLTGVRMIWVGLLVQSSATRAVTILDTVWLGSAVGILSLGLSRGWDPILTAGLSQVLPAALHATLGYFVVRWRCRPPPSSQQESPTLRELFHFYWPLAITSSMFALSRPVIFGFVSRTGDAVDTLAALRVAFDLGIIFMNPINQFRHLFVTFGKEDPRGVRIFMTQVMVVMTLAQIAIVATPLGTFVFGDLLGLKGRVLEMTIQAFWVLCLIPISMTVRNYFHGLAMIQKTTGRMSLAAVFRLILIVLSCAGFLHFGILNAPVAAGVLVMGFVIEFVVIMIYTLRERKRLLPK